MMRRAHATATVLAAALVVLFALPILPADARALASLEGAGASFPQLEIEQWRSDVKKNFSLTVNYVSSGSTFGRNQYIENLVDFGVSDIPFQPEELNRAASRPYVYVPVSAGGVGFMYNLQDKAGRKIGFPANEGGTGTDLKLTPHTACRLLTEPGMKWNDPELQNDNPDIALPANTVTPVLRSDGAGTTYVVSQFCISTAPDVWGKFVALIKSDAALAAQAQGDPFLDGKATSKFPAGWRGSTTAFASDGVANAVASASSGANAVTYNEAGFAEVRGFPNALVRNASGNFVYPESANVNAALAYASANGDGTLKLDYQGSDPTAYFPSTYSYVIAPTGISASKGTSLGTFLNYAVTNGQERADSLGYAPLSKQIVEISLDAIQKIPGAPPRPAAVSFKPGDGGVPAGGGSTGGGSTGGASTGGASTGGANTGGANTGGANTAGSSTGGANTGGGSPAGGAASGGSTGGAPADGATTGGSSSGGGGPAGGATSGSSSGGGVAGGASGATGWAPLVTVAGAVATRASGGSSQTAATRATGGGAVANAANTPLERTPSNPSAFDVLLTVLQGAALCAGGAALARRFMTGVL